MRPQGGGIAGHRPQKTAAAPPQFPAAQGNEKPANARVCGFENWHAREGSNP